jgi:hypothetical protein
VKEKARRDTSPGRMRTHKGSRKPLGRRKGTGRRSRTYVAVDGLDPGGPQVDERELERLKMFVKFVKSEARQLERKVRKRGWNNFRAAQAQSIGSKILEKVRHLGRKYGTYRTDGRSYKWR